MQEIYDNLKSQTNFSKSLKKSDLAKATRLLEDIRQFLTPNYIEEVKSFEEESCQLHSTAGNHDKSISQHLNSMKEIHLFGNFNAFKDKSIYSNDGIGSCKELLQNIGGEDEKSVQIITDEEMVIERLKRTLDEKQEERKELEVKRSEMIKEIDRLEGLVIEEGKAVEDLKTDYRSLAKKLAKAETDLLLAEARAQNLKQSKEAAKEVIPLFVKPREEKPRILSERKVPQTVFKAQYHNKPSSINFRRLDGLFVDSAPCLYNEPQSTTAESILEMTMKHSARPIRTHTESLYQTARRVSLEEEVHTEKSPIRIAGEDQRNGTPIKESPLGPCSPLQTSKEEPSGVQISSWNIDNPAELRSNIKAQTTNTELFNSDLTDVLRSGSKDTVTKVSSTQPMKSVPLNVFGNKALNTMDWKSKLDKFHTIKKKSNHFKCSDISSGSNHSNSFTKFNATLQPQFSEEGREQKQHNFAKTMTETKVEEGESKSESDDRLNTILRKRIDKFLLCRRPSNKSELQKDFEKRPIDGKRQTEPNLNSLPSDQNSFQAYTDDLVKQMNTFFKVALKQLDQNKASGSR